MRIIAGSKRGCAIGAPRGRDTRPTLDRVRESLFGILQFDVPGRCVLDLFAGSGSLGLEALSRGAAFAYFCDKDRAALRALRENIARLGFEGCSAVYPCPYEGAVAALGSAGKQAGLVFLDPPYAAGLYEKALAALVAGGVLAPGCILVAEHPPKSPPALPAGLTAYDTRRYGAVGVTFIREDKA